MDISILLLLSYKDIRGRKAVRRLQSVSLYAVHKYD